MGTAFYTRKSHQVLNGGVLESEFVVYRNSLPGCIEEGRSLDMSYTAFAIDMTSSNGLCMHQTPRVFHFLRSNNQVRIASSSYPEPMI